MPSTIRFQLSTETRLAFAARGKALKQYRLEIEPASAEADEDRCTFTGYSGGLAVVLTVDGQKGLTAKITRAYKGDNAVILRVDVRRPIRNGAALVAAFEDSFTDAFWPAAIDVRSTRSRKNL